jgi:hypothetical protein
MARLRDRSTGDLLVLMVTMTVCFAILSSGAVIVIVEITNPKTDTEAGLRTITGIINTMIGLLAGFLAGKTGSTLSSKREDDPPT